MDNFTVLLQGLNVKPLKDYLDQHQQLFYQHDKVMTPTSDRGVSVIWIHAPDPQSVIHYGNIGNGKLFWHNGYYELPHVKQLIHTLIYAGDAYAIQRCFISIIPPHCKINRHVDSDTNDTVRFHIAIDNNPDIEFWCGDKGQYETFVAQPGDGYFFRNDKIHWIENNSDQPRYSLYCDLNVDWWKSYRGLE